MIRGDFLSEDDRKTLIALARDGITVTGITVTVHSIDGRHIRG
jgi:hypothetical protein